MGRGEYRANWERIPKQEEAKEQKQEKEKILHLIPPHRLIRMTMIWRRKERTLHQLQRKVAIVPRE